MKLHLINRIALAILAALCFGLVAAQAAEFDHTHAAFDKVLKHYVKDALVDYAALKAAPKDLNAYLDKSAAVSENDFQKWTQAQQLAFLINLYNASTLRLIVDNYPVKSIKKIGSLFSGPWDQPVVRLFGKTTTLGTVEHKMLRVKYTEPRIHFAIVCAALGCPPLRSEAYTAEKLDAQLDDQGKTFLGQTEKNRIDLKMGITFLSPIFKWFREDFEKKSGSVVKFLQPYFPEDRWKEWNKGDFPIKYTDYDWSLNEQKR